MPFRRSRSVRSISARRRVCFYLIWGGCGRCAAAGPATCCARAPGGAMRVLRGGNILTESLGIGRVPHPARAVRALGPAGRFVRLALRPSRPLRQPHFFQRRGGGQLPYDGDDRWARVTCWAPSWVPASSRCCRTVCRIGLPVLLPGAPGSARVGGVFRAVYPVPAARP